MFFIKIKKQNNIKIINYKFNTNAKYYYWTSFNKKKKKKLRSNY